MGEALWIIHFSYLVLARTPSDVGAWKPWRDCKPSREYNIRRIGTLVSPPRAFIPWKWGLGHLQLHIGLSSGFTHKVMWEVMKTKKWSKPWHRMSYVRLGELLWKWSKLRPRRGYVWLRELIWKWLPWELCLAAICRLCPVESDWLFKESSTRTAKRPKIYRNTQKMTNKSQ